MTGITHQFVSGKADGVDPTVVRPSNWNADHTITGHTTWNGFNLTNVGKLGIGMLPTNVLDITQTQNASSVARIFNDSTGTAASAKFSALNHNNKEAALVMFGSGFTTAGAFRQDGALLFTDGTGGFSFSIPSNSYRWYVGGVVSIEANAGGIAVYNTAQTLYTSILSPVLTASVGSNIDIGALSEYLGYRIQLNWNAGDGYAECYVNSASSVRLIGSSQGVGGNNQFDTVNSVSSNSGEGIALVVNTGRVFVQFKTGYTGGAVRVHRFGGL